MGSRGPPCERVVLSLKEECLRRIVVPMSLPDLQIEIGLYVDWYNVHRPHQGLAGRTPAEVCANTPPANEAPRFEPRLGWPPDSLCAAPQAPPRGPPGARVQMDVAFHEGRPRPFDKLRACRLPIVQLRAAA